MLKGWSRRKFLEAGVVGAAGIPLVSVIAPARAKDRPAAFSSPQRATLSAAMDEIIPAGDGMPSATQAGCLDYLEALAQNEKGVRRELLDVVNRLNSMARRESKSRFERLTPEQRVTILRKLEARVALPDSRNLRDAVYEAYYTRPAVWKLLGFEFYPPERPGPVPAAFDEAMLKRVRRMPKLYREVQ
jgi:hypothetical protein